MSTENSPRLDFHPALHDAIREGTKTLTMRVVEGVPDRWEFADSAQNIIPHGKFAAIFQHDETDRALEILCPYIIGKVYPTNVEGFSGMKPVAITCQRLQEVSEDQALAAGVEYEAADYTHYHPFGTEAFNDADEAYEDLWSHLYPEGPKSWDANPCVWAIQFEPIKEQDEN